MDLFRRVVDPLFSVTRWICVVLLSVMVVLESLEIGMRQLTGDTPSWTKELVLLCMVWMGCMGAAVLHRERGHIALEFFADRMSGNYKRAVLMGGEVLVLLFSALILFTGVTLVTDFMNQTLPGTRMPAGLSYLPLPVTGLLLVLACVERLMELGAQEKGPDAA